MVDGERMVFLTFIDDTHVKVPNDKGDMQIVELSQSGVYAYQQEMLKSNFAQR